MRMKKIFLAAVLALIAITLSISIFAACGGENEPACTPTENILKGDYSKITDWSQVDQSKIPEAYISMIPASRVDVTKVNQQKLTSEQLSAGNNIEKVTLKNCNPLELGRALGTSVDFTGGDAKIQNGVLINGGVRIELSELANAESVRSLPDGGFEITVKSGSSAAILTQTGDTIHINGGTAQVTTVDGNTEISLNKGASFTYGDITIENIDDAKLPIWIGGAGSGVTIDGNNIDVDGNYAFNIRITGDNTYTLTNGNEVFKITPPFEGKYSGDKLLGSPGTNAIGSVCGGGSSPTGNAIKDVTGMATGACSKENPSFPIVSCMDGIDVKQGIPGPDGKLLLVDAKLKITEGDVGNYQFNAKIRPNGVGGWISLDGDEVNLQTHSIVYVKTGFLSESIYAIPNELLQRK